jgi:hypothetical protein
VTAFAGEELNENNGRRRQRAAVGFQSHTRQAHRSTGEQARVAQTHSSPAFFVILVYTTAACWTATPLPGLSRDRPPGQQFSDGHSDIATAETAEFY